MITIDDLKNVRWLTPEERAAEAHKLGLPDTFLENSRALELRLGIRLEERQILDPLCLTDSRHEADVKKFMEEKIRHNMLRRIYQGIYDRHGRIMRLQSFIYRGMYMERHDTLEEMWGPVQEILNIAYGKR